jgi:hypothetical protein
MSRRRPRKDSVVNNAEESAFVVTTDASGLPAAVRVPKKALRRRPPQLPAEELLTPEHFVIVCTGRGSHRVCQWRDLPRLGALAEPNYRLRRLPRGRLTNTPTPTAAAPTRPKATKVGPCQLLWAVATAV